MKDTHGFPRAVPPPDRTIEADHRIANELGRLAALVQKQIAATRKGPEVISRQCVVDLLGAHLSNLFAVSRLHRTISRTCDEDHVDLQQIFTELFDEYQASGLFEGRLRLEPTQPTACPVSATQASALTLAVSEIVTNAMKYAHPTGLPVEITVTVTATPEGGIALEISDDGVGLPEGFVEARDAGVGLKLVRSLVQSVDGHLDLSWDELGLTYRIALPAPG